MAEALTSFSTIRGRASRGAGTVTADVPADWLQGRSVFGGLQAVLALDAMRTLVPETLPLRTLQGTFMAPVAAGVVTATARVLRTGKSTTVVEAKVGDAALIIGVFGAPRASTAARTPVQGPVVEGPRGTLPWVPGITPAFTQHFDVAWLVGGPPYLGDRSTSHVVEIGLKDDGACSEAHLIAIADLIPPLGLNQLAAPAPSSTLTWMLELLGADVSGLPLAGWRVDAEMVAARDGYTNQRVTVWGPGGVPVALSTQSMLVFG